MKDYNKKEVLDVFNKIPKASLSKLPFEVLELDAMDFEKGDIIVGENGQLYVILGVEQTFFHNHWYYDVRFLDNSKEKMFFVNDYRGNRIVLRAKEDE